MATAILIASAVTDAHALTLGPMRVQSALGEPLRAEIDVTEISATEADGLTVSIASAAAFQAAGVPYNNALADVRATLQRRADGRYVVRLAGSRALNEPFIDLLLDASWNTGRIVRDYTLLLDPPRSQQAAAGAPLEATAPQTVSAPPAPRPAVAAPPAAARVQRTLPAPPPTEADVRTGSAEGGQQVTVRSGDTAGRIARAHKPADVSLDQMLVALLRANPEAFIGGNVNRMRAGAVLNMPSAEQAAVTPSGEARRMVTAQSRDFNNYRRRLAENAPAAQVADADRQASGRLQANVEERNAAAASPDKLTVSQGGTAEDRIAQTRQAQEASERVAELSKNISELSQLEAATGSAATPAAEAAPAAPAAPSDATPTPAPEGETAAAAAPAPAADATATSASPTAAGDQAAPADATAENAGTTAAAAPVAAPPAPAARPAPAPAPAAEPGFFAQLLDNPLFLAAGALIALLLGFLLYRVLGRKKPEAGDSVFIESRIPKDSFFGASGGESVDTKGRSSSIVSSLSYSPSQLDAGDVDPVAEADVYLAYGRDLQAEEILREALRTTPERTAIHIKLLEIHAKRRDLRAFEALATDVHKLTGGTGTDWNRVVELGHELDPGNPLYQAGVSADDEKTVPLAGLTGAAAATAAAVPAPPPAAPPPAFVPSVAPLDFDLDLSRPPASAPASLGAGLPTATQPEPAPAATVAPPSIELPDSASRAYEPTARAPLNVPHVNGLENDFDTAPAELEPITRAAALNGEERTQPATLRAGLPGDSGFIEFDMSTRSGLQDRLDTQPGDLDGAASEDSESPQAIKLSLARELQALGDTEGARSLVEEVAVESSGELKAQAQQLLGQLR